LAVAAAVAVILALNVDLGGKEETVVPVGDGTITVATDGDAGTADQIRASVVALISEVGMPDSVVDCYEREVEELPDSEFIELYGLQGEVSDSELFERMKPIKRQLASTCISREDTAHLDDPADFDDNQIEILKEGLVRHIEGKYLGDAPPGFGACIAAAMRAMPTAEFRTFLETPGQSLRDLKNECL
jgi:hypothetical protein